MTAVAGVLVLDLALELALDLLVTPVEGSLLDELVDVAASLADGADGGLAELALAVLGLLLAPQLRLARPGRCHPRHQHVLVARREVHEPDRPTPAAAAAATPSAAVAGEAPGPG